MGEAILSHRQWEIVNLLKSYKSMSVEDLSQRFSVTTTTIRRELTQLEKESFILRSRGYAHIIEQSGVSPFEERCQVCAQEKMLLAKKAIQYICPGDTILLDAGSTIYALAKEISSSEIADLAVITYSLPVANALALRCMTVLTGGTLDGETMSLVGPNAEASLDSVIVDKLFLSATGVNVRRGFTVISQLCLGMKRKMMDQAGEIIVLIDSTKWDSTGLNIFCKMQDVDRIITVRDEKNADSIAQLQQNGICVDYIDKQ